MKIKQYIPYFLTGALTMCAIMLKIEHDANKELIEIMDLQDERIELLEEYNNLLLDDRDKVYVYIYNSK